MGVSSWPLLLLPVLLLLHLCLDSHQPCLRTTCVSGDDMNFLDTRAQSSKSSVDISFQRGKQGGDFLGDGSGGDAARVMQPPAQPMKKSRRGPRSKSSQYRCVTFYRRTCISGGFDTAHAAARAYDRAAVKFRGLEADINFIISDYGEDIKQRKLCKYFGDRDLVSRGIIHDIKELLCKRLAGGELRWSS